MSDKKPIRCKGCNAVLLKGKILSSGLTAIECRCGKKNYIMSFEVEAQQNVSVKLAPASALMAP